MPQTRRQVLQHAVAAGAVSLIGSTVRAEQPSWELSEFSADVTPPLGHPLIAGWREPAKEIREPLFAKGVIWWGEEQPIVLCAVDWCELRNDAYDRWRDAIAAAVGTDRRRVLVHCLHQHDAPYADLEAQRLLDQHGLENSMFQPDFHEECVLRVVAAVKAAKDVRKRITHVGTGVATVEQVASNRRVEINGKVSFGRGSFTRDLAIRDAAAGEIDPLLRTLSFWNDDQPIAAIHCYATHPMSFYGRGEVSYDFVGMAREMRQRDDSSVFQIYLSGCAGDVTAAKFNEGDEASRVALASRLHGGMRAAWKGTRLVPLTKLKFRTAELHLDPRDTGKFGKVEAERRLADPNASQTERSQAALTLSWRKRVAAGQPIDVPAIDFGAGRLVLLPAESFVGFQLAAQRMRPDDFVMSPGYGECAPGYIPTDQTEKEGFVAAHGYAWAAPSSPQRILAALEKVLS